MRLILMILFSSILFCSHAKIVKIGVLAKRGESNTYARWNATADYLSQKISNRQFKIVALGFNELRESVAKKSIDFVLTNSVYYVDLEYRFGISRIATLIKKNRQDREMIRFGGVLFTRADNSTVKDLIDIKGKKLGAVDPLSFGGWIMARYELHKQGIEQEDFQLSFYGSHDNVVKAVIDGKVDLGTVRSDTLECMAREKKLSMKQVRIINRKPFIDFPYLSSTELYPEWPFAKLSHTSRTLANDVLIALLTMPKNSEAANSAHIAGWTIPLDYTTVHHVLQDLKLSPYDKPKEITFAEFYHTHKIQIQALGLLFITILLLVIYVLRLNKTLKHQKTTITSLNENLEQKVKRRTQKIEELLLKEKEHAELVDAILNSQDNIVLLSDGTILLRVNQALLDVSGYESLEALTGEHQCICELFIKEEGYVYAFHDKNCLEYIMEHPELEHKAKMIDQRTGHTRVYLIKSALFSLHHHNLFIITLTDISELESAYKLISDKALKDELTGIFNRRKFDEVLDLEFNRARHNNSTFSIIMFDIDDFKQINDAYGHDKGDDILKTIVTTISDNIRKSDTFARWGGEEFMILAPSMHLTFAHRTAEKLRILIASHHFEKVGHVACSFGVAEYRPDTNKATLLKEVDERLYKAKASGKNIVISD